LLCSSHGWALIPTGLKVTHVFEGIVCFKCHLLKNANYSISCIFTSWPGDAGLEWTKKAKHVGNKAGEMESESLMQKGNEDNTVVEDTDQHPLTALHLDDFNAVCKQYY